VCLGTVRGAASFIRTRSKFTQRSTGALTHAGGSAMPACDGCLCEIDVPGGAAPPQAAMWIGALLCFLFGNFVKIQVEWLLFLWHRRPQLWTPKGWGEGGPPSAAAAAGPSVTRVPPPPPLVPSPTTARCLQPWERDNVKLLYVWLFVGSAFVADQVLGFALQPASTPGPRAPGPKGKRPSGSGGVGGAPLAIGAVLVLSMTLAGLLSYIRESQNHHVLYGRHEKAVGAAPHRCHVCPPCPRARDSPLLPPQSLNPNPNMHACHGGIHRGLCSRIPGITSAPLRCVPPPGGRAPPSPHPLSPRYAQLSWSRSR
jgi:hypothetical protein